MNFQHPASLVLWRFLGVLDRIYGMHTDACSGVELWGEKIRDHVATAGGSRNKRLFFGDGNPNRPGAKYKHAATVGSVIDRNQRDGDNQALLSQACIVFLYTIWDSTVRPNYAKALGCRPGEVVSNIFGDLRLYRIAILHKKGILEKQTVALKFVDVGEPILLKRGQVDDLFSMIFEDVDQINVRFTGEQLGLEFRRNLNHPDFGKQTRP